MWAILMLLTFLLPIGGYAQSNGAIRGTVTLAANGAPLRSAVVSLRPSGRTTQSDEKGVYQFDGVRPGRYEIFVHLDSALSTERREVEVAAGQTATVDVALELTPVREAITVTASGSPETVAESFRSVTSLGSLELATRAAASLGEVLEHQPGVAKRSFGPGSSRPIIRGFDGNRVLITQDGLSTGTLSYASGDHGELIDTSTLERVEILKGPATLLYGSNALGGVVNAISGHFDLHERPHQGVSGSLSGTLGTTNAMGGASATVDYGSGNWLFWGGGGAQRTGDYDTPEGTVLNSGTELRNASLGVGRSGERTFLSVGYGYNAGRHGVPFAGILENPDEPALIDLETRLHDVRVTSGFHTESAWLEDFRLTVKYIDYQHNELEGEEVGTTFHNREVTVRGLFEQQKSGILSGRFGFSGNVRAFDTVGEEVLAPPVDQNGFALFALQELAVSKPVALQLGGRIERVSLAPEGLPSRSFTGASGSLSARFNLWNGGNLMANFMHAYRAPTLEELYNNGPHIGLLTFEVGNPDLEAETATGVEVSLRHSASRIQGEASFFYYGLSNFIFLAPTGEIEDGLAVADYTQGHSRFRGGEVAVDVGVHSSFWLNFGLDAVDARLTETDTPLPRIPPLRGRIGCELRHQGLSVKPELVIATAQKDVFQLETPTEGYRVFNLRATYSVTGRHTIHQISVNFFNLGNELYRNHSSFIKDLAPELGRGLRVNYTLRFF
jgi:iron complex outermembrane receptor protein